MCEGRDEGGEAGETPTGDERVCLGRRCRVQSRQLRGERQEGRLREGEIPTSPMEPVSSGSLGNEEEGTLGPGDTTKWVRLAQTSAHSLLGKLHLKAQASLGAVLWFTQKPRIPARTFTRHLLEDEGWLLWEVDCHSCMQPCIPSTRDSSLCASLVFQLGTAATPQLHGLGLDECYISQ